jgi:hypothetical protein
VLRVIRPRIEHRKLALADQEAVRAPEGERSWIARRQPPHAGSDLNRLAVAGVEIAVEGQAHAGFLSRHSLVSIGDADGTEG